MLHHSYALSSNRRLIVFFSPRVINKSFSLLETRSVKFIQLPDIPFFCALERITRRILKRAKMKRRILVSRRHRNALAGRQEADRTKTSTKERLPDGAKTRRHSIFGIPRPAYRFTNDALGVAFDLLTLPLAGLRSKPFARFTLDDYFRFQLLRTCFKPLRISEEAGQRGLALLKDLGVDQYKWFACLHIREAGWLGDHDRMWKNQNVLNYLPVIDYIGKLGGCVIRMGDETMTPISDKPHLIDYARSTYRSGFGDIYLCSEARFFIGCHSGLRVLPELFLTPTVNVNIWPLSPLDFHEKSLTIFSKVFSPHLGRCLSLNEVMAEPTFCFRETDDEYRASGWTIIENSPQEILEAVKEFIDIIDTDSFGRWSSDQRFFQEQLQTTLRSSKFVREFGDTMFYPDALCRLGTRYLDQHWEKQGKWA